MYNVHAIIEFTTSVYIVILQYNVFNNLDKIHNKHFNKELTAEWGWRLGTCLCRGCRPKKIISYIKSMVSMWKKVIQKDFSTSHNGITVSYECFQKINFYNVANNMTTSSGFLIRFLIFYHSTYMHYKIYEPYSPKIYDFSKSRFKINNMYQFYIMIRDRKCHNIYLKVSQSYDKKIISQWWYTWTQTDMIHNNNSDHHSINSCLNIKHLYFNNIVYK